MSLKGRENDIARLQVHLQKGKISQEEYDREMQRLMGSAYVPPEPRKKENPLWKLTKTLLGFAVGGIVWYLVYMLVRLIIALIAQVPFLGAILYYPSDASWALIVMPPTAAIFAGSFCSVKLSNSSKLFSAAIILLYGYDVITMLTSSAFQWSTLIIALISIGTAALTFPTRRADL